MIDGVEIIKLHPQEDWRGSLTELYAFGGSSRTELLQWNLVRSAGGVLRGMHVHVFYDEYYVPLEGSLFMALADIRPSSPTSGQIQALHWDGTPDAIKVPRGVAHGVYGEQPYLIVYGLSSPFDGKGELGCRFDDPELRIDWPVDSPMLSERDRQAGSYRKLLEDYAEAEAKRTHE